MLDGRYGPYVTHNKVNATVPRGKEPAALSVDEALALLAERIAKGGGKKKPARKAAAKPANDDGAAPKKSVAKKAPAKKAPAKKAGAKKGKPRADAAE